MRRVGIFWFHFPYIGKVRWWETVRRKGKIAGAAMLALFAFGLLWLSPRFYARSVPGAATGGKYVALTFDDGPSPRTTPLLLDGLKAREARATFFVLGTEAEGNRDILRRMEAEGHQVGQHTYSHVRLDKLDDEAVRAELSRTDALLRDVLGEGDYWIRPPYGLMEPRQYRLADTTLIMWSVDPEDWKKLNEESVTQAVLRTVKSGDVILLHDIYETSVRAALDIVDALQAEGYTFVTVRELMELSGVTPEAGELYRSPTLPGRGW